MEIKDFSGRVLFSDSSGTLRDCVVAAVKACADLRNARLRNADLTGADLRNARLRNADLTGADLTGACLTGADLRNAHLTGADLTGADLRNARLRNAMLPPFAVCPEVGAFRGFKKLAGGVIAELGIPADALRTSSLVGRRCRASKAMVLSLSDGATEGVNRHTGRLTYRVGEYVYPDSWDGDIRVECTHGIHFFITRAEAEAY